MNLILIGPPGAGKGTQAIRLCDYLHVVHISTGDIFRAAIANQTPLGKEAGGYVNRGELVPDSLTIKLIEERLRQPDVSGGFLMDGFPRSVPQAEAFDRMLGEHGQKIDLVIELQVPSEKLVRRLSGRWVCPACGASYHTELHPSKSIGFCDECGGALTQREDDRPEPVRRRLTSYETQLGPVLKYYDQQGLLRRVNGDQPVDEVFADIKKVISAR
jgi:adenylate kinase